MKKLMIAAMALAGCSLLPVAQNLRNDTYCNPLNVDYTYMIYNSATNTSYRSGADPAVVEFRGEYYMFVTRTHGYWHSTDLQNWDFIKPNDWYPQGSNAPAAHNYKDSVLYVCGDPSGCMSVLYTDDPKSGNWKATPGILFDLQDPDLFIDDDGRAYMFWGSSNVFPIRGMELDPNRRFLPKTEKKELFNLDLANHGWERFGENHVSDTNLGGFIEGPWLTKHNGKYYMQYAAPGTQFNVYGDGVYVADSPMGPYTYQKHNPISYKPGGYMNGAGHGSTVVGPGGKYWHFSSMALAINVGWERRLCMFPTKFDADGIMYCDTRFGDYPHYAPAVPGHHGDFRGWMLLSYGKPVTVSSQVDGNDAQGLTDEKTKSFWLASKNDDTQWATIDLQTPANVCAIQVNFHDHKCDMYGRYDGLRTRYTIEGSLDGNEWHTIVDRSNSYKDTPNDYAELETPEQLRYIRYKNVKVPTPSLAISEIRVFGLGNGKAPATPKKLTLKRHDDRRDIDIEWAEVKGAQGYNVLWGIAPDKLYSSWLVYGDHNLLMRCLTVDQDYYFAVEAFNENGVSTRSQVIHVE